MLRAVGVGGIDRLALRHPQLVLEVPLHLLQVRHAQHVAVRVVAVAGGAVGLGLRRIGDVLVRRLLCLAGFDLARLRRRRRSRVQPGFAGSVPTCCIFSKLPAASYT